MMARAVLRPFPVTTRPLLLLLSPLLGSCTLYDGNRGIVPFFEIVERPARTAGAGKVMVPEGESVDAASSTEIVLRPLGSFEAIGPPETRRSRLKLLWPIGDYAWGQGDQRHWTLPIFYYRRKPILARYLEPPHLRAEGADLDWMVFPIFFGGHDPREGGYFAVFPLGGVLRGLLGKDETHFALFPIYWRSWQGEYDSLHVVFPFFNRVRGGGHSGWRLLPFYGRYAADRPEDGVPRYRRLFVLWPFWIDQENNLDTERPETLFFSLPFYGQSLNPRTETYTALWPIFHWTRDLETGNSLHFGYLIPYRFTGGQCDVWPLFGWKRRVADHTIGARDWRGIAGPGGVVTLGASEEEMASLRPSALNTRFREFAPWPIQRWDRDQGETWESTKLWVLPFFWNFQTLDKNTFELTSEWKVWPLWRYRSRGERTTLYFPSPLWFRQENLFERLYARLWRLFLYTDGPERRGWEFLYGFLGYRAEKVEEEKTFSIFYGLFEWSAGKAGHRFRLLYLPWR